MTPLARRMRKRGWSDARAATNVAIGLAIALERIHADGLVHGHISPESVGIRQDGAVVLHPPAPPPPAEGESADPPGDEGPADITPPGEPSREEHGARRATGPDGVPPPPPAPDADESRDARTDPGQHQPTETFPVTGRAGASGDSVTRDDDCYAVGTLLYAMLTGADAAAADQEGHRTTLAQRSDVPPEVAAVVARAVHPNPPERYHSAEHLHADLVAARAFFPARAARSKGSRPSSRPNGRTILIAIVLLAAVVAGLWYFLLRDDSVTVPNVVGQTTEQAERAIRDAGLEPRTENEWSAGVATGLVIRTDPEGGASRKRGGTVTVVISGFAGDGAPSDVFVPDVVGRSEADALQALEGAGLTPSVARTSDAQPAGTVIRLDPPSASRVPSSSSVTVTVSSGPSGATTSTETTTQPDTTTEPGPDTEPGQDEFSPPFLDDPSGDPSMRP